MHYLISLDRPPRPVKGSEPLVGVDPSFDRSMILFHNVVQVRTGATATTTAAFALLLQFRHHLRIGGVAELKTERKLVLNCINSSASG